MSGKKVVRSISDSEMRQRAALAARQLPSLVPPSKTKRKPTGVSSHAPPVSPAAQLAQTAASDSPLNRRGPSKFLSMFAPKTEKKLKPSRSQKEIDQALAAWMSGMFFKKQ